MRHTLRLAGVRPEPLAGYLKGMALLRIVGEQVDPTATGSWRDDVFVLDSPLDLESLLDFFQQRWAPSSLVAPWNGGSGFYPKDQRSGIDTINASTGDRFAAYRTAIEAGRTALRTIGADDKPRLLAHLRATLPDDAIRWLDAAIVLTGSDPKYPPILGTGGNDGRFEFSNNQMQRLSELLLDPDRAGISALQLRSAITGIDAPRARGVSIGQFAPGQAGGANTGMGFGRDSLINPWDFVFALEGAITFAASVSRAFDASGGAAFPFYVRAAAAGYASASAAEEARGELWMPLWEKPATAAEIMALAGEGRAWVDGRPAESAGDFGRAIRQLGVSRGIGSFQRFVLAQRNGLAFFATSAGRYHVVSNPVSDPLTPIDAWWRAIERAVRGNDECPAAVRTATRRVESAILDPAPSTKSDETMLLALSSLAWAVTRSRRHRALEFLPPMPPTSRTSWPALVHSTDPTWRIAFLLAGGALRYELQPITDVMRPRWDDSRGREGEFYPDVPIVERLRRVARRRLLEQPARYVATCTNAASLADFAVLANGTMDGRSLGEAVDAATLTTDERVEPPRNDREDDDASPPVTLAATLCAAALYGPPDWYEPWPLPSSMLHALIAGDGERAVVAARRHLQAQNVPTELPPTTMSRDAARWLTVALLLPLSRTARRTIWHAITSTSTPTR